MKLSSDFYRKKRDGQRLPFLEVSARGQHRQLVGVRADAKLRTLKASHTQRLLFACGSSWARLSFKACCAHSLRSAMAQWVEKTMSKRATSAARKGKCFLRGVFFHYWHEKGLQKRETQKSGKAQFVQGGKRFLRRSVCASTFAVIRRSKMALDKKWRRSASKRFENVRILDDYLRSRWHKSGLCSTFHFGQLFFIGLVAHGPLRA